MGKKSDNPIGSDFRVVFEDLWAREVSTSSSSCRDVEDGDRMHIERLVISGTVADLNTDWDCGFWILGRE